MLIAALPILVELFTSEGCSSCPPADAVLARLDAKQPAPGVQLVVLSEHVDYWNHQGWRDPFSSRAFSERQERYSGRAYTPQAMVDGRTDVLGSDEAGILRAAAAAAREPHGEVALGDCPSGPPGAAGPPPGPPAKKNNFFFDGGTRSGGAGRDCVRISVANLPPHGPAEVFLAVLEDGLTSKVVGGENGGRTLSHTAVVRALEKKGSIAAGAMGWQGQVDLPRDAAWGRTRLAVFVQDRESLRVLGTGSR